MSVRKIRKTGKANPKEVRDHNIYEIDKRITTHQHYINIAFQANGFFYLTTGAVLGYYLNKIDNEYLIYFLLLPILLGTVLGGVFIYGASLNRESSFIIEKLQRSLDNDGIVVDNIPDVNLLHILLRIFGYILLLVVATLIIMPLFISPNKSTNNCNFLIIAGIIIVSGVVSSHWIACKQYRKLRKQVIEYDRKLKKQKMKNINELKKQQIVPKKCIICYFIK